MSEDLFNHPEVIAVIRAILVSKGIRNEADIEDGIGSVQEEAIVRTRETGKPPKDKDEAKAIVRPIANGNGVDEVRKRNRGSGRNAGPTDKADDHAVERHRTYDPSDEKKLLAVFHDVVSEKGQDGSNGAKEQVLTFEAIGSQGDGAQAERAKELGISDAALRKRVQKTRHTFFERVREEGLGSLLPRSARRVAVGVVVAGVALFLVVRSVDWSGGDKVGNPPPRITAEDRQKAEELRAVGHTKALAKDWKACVDAYEAAERLDYENVPAAAQEEADACKARLDEQEGKRQ